MLTHFEKAFEEIRHFLWEEGGFRQVYLVGGGQKTKDVTTGFDLEAEKRAIRHFEDEDLPVVFLAEEQGRVDISKGQPEWLILMDPVDGSTNLKNGIEGSAFCITGIPYRSDERISPRDVQYALIGSLVSGSYVEAGPEEGVYYKGIFSGQQRVRVYPSGNKELNLSRVEIDLDFALDEASGTLDAAEGSKIRRILPLAYPIRKIKHIRRNGSAGIGLMGVPTGAVDAYIDARDISTPENWIGAQMLVRKGGGFFTDLKGRPIEDVESMTTPYSYVASGNGYIHGKLLELLDV